MWNLIIIVGIIIVGLVGLAALALVALGGMLYVYDKIFGCKCDCHEKGYPRCGLCDEEHYDKA